MMAPHLCVFCGATKRTETICAECTQSDDGIEWTVEPREWTPARTAWEALLVSGCGLLFTLPIAHLFAAVLVAMGVVRGTDITARVIVALVIAIMAAVEVSLLRGLMNRVLRRWARRWRFKAPGGAGWVQVAAGQALRGFGSVRHDEAQYRWIADYLQGSRNATRVPAR